MISLKGVSKVYNPGKGTEVQALRDVCLQVRKGDFISITGPSGSGKSTLLHIMAGLDTPTGGEYLFEDVDVARASDRVRCRLRNREIGIVLQDFGLLGDDTALENVALPLIIGGVRMREAKSRSERVLEEVGIAELAAKRVNQLSGGQRQRVAVARALARDAKLLLADEPTGALDSGNAKALMDLFERLNAGGLTIITVTHNMAVAERTPISYSIVDGMIHSARGGH